MLPVRLFQPRHVALVCLLALGFAYECYALFVQPHGLAGNGGGPTRLVGEIALGTGVRQTFWMNADGLNGIAVRARASGATVEGDAVLELSEILDGVGTAGIYRIVHPAQHLAASSSYWWRFPPLEHSRGRRYRLSIQLPETPDGSGLVLEATVENAYREGMLWLGDREQWGDLVFETSAARATVFAGLQSLWRDLPWGVGAVSFGVVFVLFNVALAIAVRALLFESGVA